MAGPALRPSDAVPNVRRGQTVQRLGFKAQPLASSFDNKRVAVVEMVLEMAGPLLHQWIYSSCAGIEPSAYETISKVYSVGNDLPSTTCRFHCTHS